mmetsp:Transcript_25734/g.38074  ORF Transcript_25734/g.38074 Transcript_25734/m.38074 type:complete len:259 (+) Transcript_25734:1363-2139(+)
MLLPVVGDRLVERSVLLVGNILSLAHPDGLLFVEVIPRFGDLLDLLRLLLLLPIFLVDIFNLGLVFIITLLVLLLILVISDFLLFLLLGVETDGETNKLGVLLDKILEAALLEVLLHVLLQVKNNTSTTSKWLGSIRGNSEGATSSRLPNMLLIIVILGVNNNLVGHKVGRVKPDTELSDHANISTSGKGLHESLGTRLGDSTEVVNKISLSHTNTSVLNSESLVGLVGNKSNLHRRLVLKSRGVGKTHVADLVQSIR